MPRFKTREEEIEAIRREPTIRALVTELQAQAPERLDALMDWLNQEQVELEDTTKGDGHAEKDRP